MMKPDPSFVRQLKEVCTSLEVTWEIPQERWVIWYNNPDGRRFRIHDVKNPDGSYRGLDSRVIEMLKRCDMSRKIDSPEYVVSEHLRKAKEYKELTRQKQRAEAVKRSQDSLSKWKSALVNAERGIFNPKQLGRQTIYSFAPAPVTQKLLHKFGRPHLAGAPIVLKP